MNFIIWFNLKHALSFENHNSFHNFTRVWYHLKSNYTIMISLASDPIVSIIHITIKLGICCASKSTIHIMISLQIEYHLISNINFTISLGIHFHSLCIINIMILFWIHYQWKSKSLHNSFDDLMWRYKRDNIQRVDSHSGPFSSIIQRWRNDYVMVESSRDHNVTVLMT